MYRSEYIVCFRSEISFVPLLFSHRTPFLRPYWQIYFNSTSNHNQGCQQRVARQLFLISILHQTTTSSRCALRSVCCFLFQFYIKPQPRRWNRWNGIRCFLFQFYIKPQPSDMRFIDCHSVMWPNERYERRMTGQGSRNDAGFEYIKITAPGNQLYTKLSTSYVANFTSLMRRENQQIQLMLILCYPVI